MNLFHGIGKQARALFGGNLGKVALFSGIVSMSVGSQLRDYASYIMEQSPVGSDSLCCRKHSNHRRHDLLRLGAISA